MNKSFVCEINDFIQKLEKDDYSKFVISLVDSLLKNSNDYNKKIAVNAFMRVDKKALQKVFRGLIEWDASSIGILKKVKCPTLCIITDEHHCSYKNISREAPQFEIAKVIGSKWWATLEVPDQINAMIARFFSLSSKIDPLLNE